VTGSWRYDYSDAGPGCTAWPCAYGKRTFTAFQYDEWGNKIVERQYGDIDATGDEIRIERLYRVRGDTFVTRRAAAETEFDGVDGGSLLRQSVFHYDGASTWDQGVAIGSVTRRRDWYDSTSSFVDTAWTYDARGNQTTMTDPEGAITTTIWDDA